MMRKKKRAGRIIAISLIILAVSAVGLSEGTEYQRQKKVDEMAKIDLLELYKQNNDLVGWIQIPGTNINYPVMNREYYLNRTFEKKWSRSGLPFIEDGCTEESLDTLIYAHNMRYDNSMFSALEGYTDKAFWKDHKTVHYYVICTKENGEKYVEKRTHKVMSAIQTRTDQWAYWGYVKTDTFEGIEGYVDACKERQLYDTDVQSTGRILTMSTCSYHTKGKKGRLVVVSALKGVKRQSVVDQI